MAWQLQDAKNQFSKLVQKAQQDGPQVVTLRGERAVVVISARDYDELRFNRPTLVDDLLAGPRWDDELIKVIAERAKLPSGDTGFWRTWSTPMSFRNGI